MVSLNLYNEQALEGRKESFEEGIKIQCEEIKTLQFANHTEILSDTA